jgi:regulator of sigma E protease
METIIMIAQIILSLSILVGLHELGHLIAAKFFGMRVEQYSIGFPPKVFGVKYGETVYSIGAIPLGGFVKISGMIDESLDTEKMKEEPKEWEFRAKPAWQRLIVMMGGIIINVILGIIIFIGLQYYFGETYVTKEETNKYGIYAMGLGKELGLKTGDRIIKVNGQDYEKFSDIMGPEVTLGSSSYYTVDRDGEIFDISIPSDFIERLNSEGKDDGFITILQPYEVGKVLKGSAAQAAGLKSGDQILEVNGQPAVYFQLLREVIVENKGKEISLKVLQDGETKSLTAQVNQEGLIGFRPNSLLETQRIQYTFIEAVKSGTKEAFQVTVFNIRGLGKIIRGEVGRKSVKSVIGIAEYFGGNWDWQRFWFLTGMLSMWLAFLNFLPIPALDGGHVMFLSYEIISGRKPSDKFLEGAQKVGMAFLLVLMVFLIGNDIINAIFD